LLDTFKTTGYYFEELELVIWIFLNFISTAGHFLLYRLCDDDFFYFHRKDAEAARLL